MLESISMRTYSHEIILYFSIDIGSNYLRNILERLEQILRTYLVNFLLRIHKWMWALSKPFTGLNMFKFDQIETKCTVESVWPSGSGYHTDTKIDWSELINKSRIVCIEIQHKNHYFCDIKHQSHNNNYLGLIPGDIR